MGFALLAISACSFRSGEEDTNLLKKFQDQIQSGKLPLACLEMDLRVDPVSGSQLKDLAECQNADGKAQAYVDLIEVLSPAELEDLVSPLNHRSSREDETLSARLFNALDDLDRNEKDGVSELEQMADSQSALLNTSVVPSLLKVFRAFNKEEEHFEKLILHLEKFPFDLSYEDLFQVLKDLSSTEEYDNAFDSFQSTKPDESHYMILGRSLEQMFSCSDTRGLDSDDESCQEELLDQFEDQISILRKTLPELDAFWGEDPAQALNRIRAFSSFVEFLVKGAEGEGVDYFEMSSKLSGLMTQDIYCKGSDPRQGGRGMISADKHRKKIIDIMVSDRSDREVHEELLQTTTLEVIGGGLYCEIPEEVYENYHLVYDAFEHGHLPTIRNFIRFTAEDLRAPELIFRSLSWDRVAPLKPFLRDLVDKNLLEPSLKVLYRLKPHSREILKQWLDAFFISSNRGEKERFHSVVGDLASLLSQIQAETWADVLKGLSEIAHLDRPFLQKSLNFLKVIFDHTMDGAPAESTTRGELLISPGFRRVIARLADYPELIFRASNLLSDQMKKDDGRFVSMIRLILFVTGGSTETKSRLADMQSHTRGSLNDGGNPWSPPPGEDVSPYESCRWLVDKEVDLYEIGSDRESMKRLVHCLRAHEKVHGQADIKSYLGSLIEQLDRYRVPGSNESYLKAFMSRANPLFKGDMIATQISLFAEMARDGSLTELLKTLSLFVESFSGSNVSSDIETHYPSYLELPPKEWRWAPTSFFEGIVPFLQLYHLYDIENGLEHSAFNPLSQSVGHPGFYQATTFLKTWFEKRAWFEKKTLQRDLPEKEKECGAVEMASDRRWPDCLTPSLPIQLDNRELLDQMEALGFEPGSEDLERLKREFQSSIGMDQYKTSWDEKELQKRVSSVLAEFQEGETFQAFIDYTREDKELSIPEKEFFWKGDSKRFVKFLRKYSLDPEFQRVIPYWYPGEEEPRPRLVHALDELLLLLVNGDFEVKKVLGLIDTGYGNVAIRTMRRLAKAGKTDAKDELEKNRNELNGVLMDLYLLFEPHYGDPDWDENGDGEVDEGKKKFERNGLRRRRHNMIQSFDVLERIYDEGDLDVLQALFLALERASPEGAGNDPEENQIKLLVDLSHIGWLRLFSYLTEPLSDKDQFGVSALEETIDMLSKKENNETRDLVQTLLLKHAHLVSRFIESIYKEYEGSETSIKSLKNFIYQAIRASSESRLVDTEKAALLIKNFVSKSPSLSGDFLPILLAKISEDRRLASLLQDLLNDLQRGEREKLARMLKELLDNPDMLAWTSELADLFEKIYVEKPMAWHRLWSAYFAFLDQLDQTGLSFENIFRGFFGSLEKVLNSPKSDPLFQERAASFLEKYPPEKLLFLFVREPLLQEREASHYARFLLQRWFASPSGLSQSENLPLQETYLAWKGLSPLLAEGELEEYFLEMDELIDQKNHFPLRAEPLSLFPLP